MLSILRTHKLLWSVKLALSQGGIKERHLSTLHPPGLMSGMLSEWTWLLFPGTSPRTGLFPAGLMYDLVKLLHFFSWFMTFAILHREAKKLDIKGSSCILKDSFFCLYWETSEDECLYVCAWILLSSIITELCSGLSVMWVNVSHAQCYTKDATCFHLGQRCIWMYLHFCKGDVFFCFSIEQHPQCMGSV